jgi:hypothetical protein
MFHSPSIENWLTDVHVYVREKAPELLPMLDVYSGEARFGRRYIAGICCDCIGSGGA